jgi:ATP-dependent Lon protease
MTKDSKVKTAATTSKKDKSSTKSKKREEIKQRRKNNESSDSESDSYIETEDDEEEDEIDIPEYRKFISKIFPSKYMDKKVKDTNKLKKLCDDIMKNDKKKKEKQERDDDESEEDADDEEDEEEEHKKKSAKKKPVKKYGNKLKKPVKSLKRDKSKKNLKKDESESESEKSSDDSEDDDDDDDNEKSGSNKVNIIFTIGGHADEDEESIWEDYDSEEDEDYDESETEDEDESVSTDSSSDDEDDDDYDSDEDYVEEDDESEEEEEDVVVKKSKKSSKNHVLKITNEKETDVNSENESSEDDVLKQLKELQGKNKNNKAILDCIETYEEKVKENKKKKAKKEKKQKAKNSRIFKRVIRDKNTMNDFKFFEKLETEEQKKIIKEVREINKISRVEKPYRMTLLESNIPAVFKASAMKKIASLRYMEPGSGEYYKIKNWVDTFMRIPFGKYETLPVNISDGVEACHEFMEKAQKTLDDAVYGLNDAKMQIMQMLGQLVTNPEAIGSAIAIKGPMGTGKTSLVKEGISKILNRPFSFIALGGATDSSFLEGHSYTYEGSVWGKIVQIIIDSKCMNPVIYFDELDKISDTPKGEEIAGILTHLTDTSQNSQFHDKYFSEIDFDLSKCLFIFSYNDESKVNPILRDRMYKIQTKGYDKKEKTIISTNYLLPKIREQVKFTSEDIVIPDNTIHHIIEEYCMKEDGVRNLKRCLEIIYTKLNLYRLMKPGTNLFEQEMSLKVEFPMSVTNDVVDKLIKKDKETLSKSLYGLYV